MTEHTLHGATYLKTYGTRRSWETSCTFITFLSKHPLLTSGTRLTISSLEECNRNDRKLEKSWFFLIQVSYKKIASFYLTKAGPFIRNQVQNRLNFHYLLQIHHCLFCFIFGLWLILIFLCIPSEAKLSNKKKIMFRIYYKLSASQLVIYFQMNSQCFLFIKISLVSYSRSLKSLSMLSI